MVVHPGRLARDAVQGHARVVARVDLQLVEGQGAVVHHVRADEAPAWVAMALKIDPVEQMELVVRSQLEASIEDLNPANPDDAGWIDAPVE